MAWNQKGNADKRAGTKTGNAPHPTKLDDRFGSKTNYADPAKTKVGIGKDKAKG